MNAPWEIGSEFHWDPGFVRRHAAIHPDAGTGIYARGVGALMALMTHWSTEERRPRLHLPSYYCMDVAERLSTVCDVSWFSDLPTRSSPRFETLEAEAGDFVLALNHFGQWTDARWSGYVKPVGVMLIEDHSHDPFSAWALRSRADYVLASLRKTLPITDGARLWSPAGLPVPSPLGSEPEGAGIKLAAMLLKAAYLDGAAVGKADYRALQIQGERLLDEPPFAPASAFTRAVLPFVDGPALRGRRMANNERLRERLGRGEDAAFALVEPAGANDVPSFSPVLLCESRMVRDELRAHLQRHAVFAPNHWPQEVDGYNSGDAEAVSLAGRLLTLPIDFRYDFDDVDAVTAILADFRPSKPTLHSH